VVHTHVYDRFAFTPRLALTSPTSDCGKTTLDDQRPRKLAQATLASLLKAFHIRSRSVWPTGRTADSKSRKGYYRTDFEAAWQAYCPRDGTPAQPNVFKLLRNA
jgi:hypothetical protein